MFNLINALVFISVRNVTGKRPALYRQVSVNLPTSVWTFFEPSATLPPGIVRPYSTQISKAASSKSQFELKTVDKASALASFDWTLKVILSSEDSSVRLLTASLPCREKYPLESVRPFG